MARGAPRPVFKPQPGLSPAAAGRGRGRGAQPAGAASSDPARKHPGGDASQKPQRPSINVNPFGNAAAGAEPQQTGATNEEQKSEAISQ